MSQLTFLQLTNTLESYISDNWSYTPIAWENEQFSTPENDPFIYVNIIYNPSENEGLGTDCVRLHGSISVRVFTRYDIGLKTSLDLVDKLIEILENKTIGTILTYTTDVLKEGDAARQMNRIESGWHMILCSTRYETS